MPAFLPEGLCLAAFPPREDPRDVLLTRAGGSLHDLPRGARVATSSLRRRALLLARRPDLTIEPIRGNVDTRLKKLGDGLYDAMLDELEGRFSALKGLVRNDAGEIHHHVNLYVNSEAIESLQGLQTSLKDGDEVSIIPALAGGRGLGG